MNCTKKRIAVYLRVSTGKQFEDGYGLDAQKERCLAYIKYRDIEPSLVDTFVDGGYSAGTMDRPKFNELWIDCELEIYDTVIVYKLDRISRNISDFCEILDFFSSHNIQLISISENLDLSSVVGALIAKILIVFAEYERQLTSSRTIEAMRNMIIEKKMYPYGGIPPRGYIRHEKKLIIDPDGSASYLYAINTFLETRSIKETLSLCMLHYPNFSWTERGLVLMLRSKTYLGGIEFQGEFYPGIHEPLIQQDQYDKIQQILNGHIKESKYIYLYRGLIVCKECGSVLRCTCGTGHLGKSYLYYKCPKCKKSISEKQVAQQMIPYFSKIPDDTEMMDIQNVTSKSTKLTDELSKLKKLEDQLMQQTMANQLEVQDYVKFIKKIKIQKRPLEIKLRNIKSEKTKQIRKQYEFFNSTNKYVFLHKHIKTIFVDVKNKCIENVSFVEKNIKK